MKITRKMLLVILICLVILLIAYTAIRHLFALGLNETTDKYVTNGIIIAALILFAYSRFIMRNEKKTKERILQDAAPPVEEAKQHEQEKEK